MDEKQIPEIRKGQGDVKLSRDEFERRLRERFYDPAFDAVATELQKIVDVAWTAYDEYRKSPRTQAAGRALPIHSFNYPSNGSRPATASSLRSVSMTTPQVCPGFLSYVAPTATTRPAPERCPSHFASFNWRVK
jgi:hypothetical protein